MTDRSAVGVRVCHWPPAAYFRLEMTAVAITSESATSTPSALSQLIPDGVANVLGVANEADRDGDGEEQGGGPGDRPLVMTAVAFAHRQP